MPVFGDTNFSEFRELYTNNPTANLRVADLDADGRPELIVNGARFSESLKPLAAGFGAPVRITGGFVEVFGDLDRDGDVDAVATYRRPGSFARRISWLANDGTGSFLPGENLINNALDADFMPPADIDGDGDGVPLFVEFACGFDPLKPDAVPVPTTYLDGNRVRADYEYLRRKDASELGLSYTPEVSEMMAWGDWLTRTLSSSGSDLANGYARVIRERQSIQSGRCSAFFGRFCVKYDPPAED